MPFKWLESTVSQEFSFSRLNKSEHSKHDTGYDSVTEEKSASITHLAITMVVTASEKNH